VFVRACVYLCVCVGAWARVVAGDGARARACTYWVIKMFMGIFSFALRSAFRERFLLKSLITYCYHTSHTLLIVFVFNSRIFIKCILKNNSYYAALSMVRLEPRIKRTINV
jgi:hypothetical protein